MACMKYQPSETILKRYANILVNFALNDGQGIKAGEVVRIVVRESAKPLYFQLRTAVLRVGGHVIGQYMPDDEPGMNFSRSFYELASREQLCFFPKKYWRGLVDQMDHSIIILSETNKLALEGIDPKRIMLTQQAAKPYRDWLTKKENRGEFTSTIALYGTEEMAKHAHLSLKEYWQQIIQACFLNQANPIKQWRQTFARLARWEKDLNNLAIEKLHIEGKDADLWIQLGSKRRWLSGSGRNIPSFELFTAPDWRGTEGWIRFNQPLYRNEHLITGIELQFKKGRVVEARAKRNSKYLKEMLRVQGADRVGEYSLTDARLSRITKFMADALYDENLGGKEGNTHLALGLAYQDCYAGDPAKVEKQQWQRLGFNDSAIHTDIISTTKRQVTAYLKDGSSRVLYRDGKFTF